MKQPAQSHSLRRAAQMTAVVTLAWSCLYAVAQVGPSLSEALALTGLHGAAHRGETAQIEKLAAAKADHQSVRWHRAHRRGPPGHDGVVRQLIKAGAPLDHVNNLHWTAVIESIVLGDGGRRHQVTLKALIDAGANLNLKDRTGTTPLQLARGHSYAEMVKMLEVAGAK